MNAGRTVNTRKEGLLFVIRHFYAHFVGFKSIPQHTMQYIEQWRDNNADDDGLYHHKTRMDSNSSQQNSTNI
jgi:hypothetical protein